MSRLRRSQPLATRSLPRRRRGARAAEASAGIDFCEGMLINLISEASSSFNRRRRLCIRGRAATRSRRMTTFGPRTTALVLIDLQNGILGMPLAPRSGAEVLATATDLAARFRAAGAAVVPVHVGWSADFADALKQPVDRPMPRPAGGTARRLERSRRRSGRTRRYRRHQAAMGRLLRHRSGPAATPARRHHHRARRHRHQFRR